MNPAVIALVGKIASHLIDKKSKLNFTNITSASGATIVMTGVGMLTVGEPQLQVPAYVVMAAGCIVTFLKNRS